MKNEEIIKQMTLEEKASLMSGRDFWTTKSVERLGIPSVFLSDGPHGLRKQAAASDHLGLNASLPSTCFPTAVTMANSWNEENGEKLGKALGEEALALKVNFVLGPGLNIKRNPLCGRCFEYFSEDPYLAGKMAASYVRGIQSNGVASCVKHFACNSQETKRMVVDSVLDERTLREIYLTNFEIAVKEGRPHSIMSSYNPINGEYANENKHLLVDILRKEWGFDGIVVSDWGGNNDRIKAIEALSSLEMPTTGGETDRDIVKAVKEGKLKEEYLDECVDLFIETIKQVNKPFEENKKYEFDKKQHHEIAKELALDSAVLLKNENNLLPLKNNEKVCIIGDFADTPRYQGAGSSIVNPTQLDKPLDEIKKYDLNFIGFEKGYSRYGKKSKGLIKKACKLAKKSDVVILYIGLDEITEAEGLDRTNISLPQNQLDLIDALSKLNKKIVCVLACGSVVDLSFDNKVNALLHIYLSGQAGASATFDILTGKVSPSGKLSETIPLSYNDYPTKGDFPSKKLTAEYREGIYVGYRFFDKNNIKVRYPFGFGLSYANFIYSDLKVNENGITLKIKNDSDIKAKEVVEMYIGMPDSRIFRANKELKGFKKVELEPHEEKTIMIPFDDKTFRFFNAKSNKFEVEGGNYKIYVGSSVEDIRLFGDIEKEGDMTEVPYKEADLPDYYSGKIVNVDSKEFESLLGRPIPDGSYKFIKKNRILVNDNTVVADLKYARGWTGRAFSGAIRFATWFLRKIGQRTLSNTLIMGVWNLPLRGLSRLTGGALSYTQLNGLITMFNGHFFKGLHQFNKASKARRKLEKELKKQK